MKMLSQSIFLDVESFDTIFIYTKDTPALPLPIQYHKTLKNSKIEITPNVLARLYLKTCFSTTKLPGAIGVIILGKGSKTPATETFHYGGSIVPPFPFGKIR